MKQWDAGRRGTFTAPVASPPLPQEAWEELCLFLNWPWRAGPSLCRAGCPTELPLKGQRDWKPTTPLPWPNERPSAIPSEKQLWENVAALTSITFSSTGGLKALGLEAPVT